MKRLFIGLLAGFVVGTLVVGSLVSADVPNQREATLIPALRTALNGILDASDDVDGEQIADDTIDDDAIDFSDVTISDYMPAALGTAPTNSVAGSFTVAINGTNYIVGVYLN